MHVRTISTGHKPQPASALGDQLQKIAELLTVAATAMTALATIEGLISKE